jgi:hypothetical protein
MPATDYWIVLKDGKKVYFKTRPEANNWIRSQKDYPRGHYHVYDNNPDGYIGKNRGTSFRESKKFR